MARYPPSPLFSSFAGSHDEPRGDLAPRLEKYRDLGVPRAPGRKSAEANGTITSHGYNWGRL